MKIAVIDCGTNTFTLNLFEINKKGKFKRIDKSRHYVELAAEGIHRIGPKAFQRGIEAFKVFREFLQANPVTHVKALGTAALRQASNNQEFVQAAYEVSNIKIDIISGKEEAELIYRGVGLAAPLGKKPSLIMDIGGGSVEFIIGNKQEIYWANSYPVGVAVLYELFHKSDPISNSQKAALQAHLQEVLADFLPLLTQYKIEYFIGSSGSFNMLDKLAGTRKSKTTYSVIERKKFEKVTKALVNSNYDDRLLIPNLKPNRAKLSVVSVLLIDFIQQHLSTQEMIVSSHAMREGLLQVILEAEQ